MARRILDSSVLIGLWHQRKGASKGAVTKKIVKRWASEVIDLYSTNLIVTPVYIEMIAGVTSKQELKLTEAFLEEFAALDNSKIVEDDWQNAIRLAKRVPKNRKPRHLGDCLIQAIAERFGCDVVTRDKGFPSR